MAIWYHYFYILGLSPNIATISRTNGAHQLPHRNFRDCDHCLFWRDCAGHSPDTVIRFTRKNLHQKTLRPCSMFFFDVNLVDSHHIHRVLVQHFLSCFIGSTFVLRIPLYLISANQIGMYLLFNSQWCSDLGNRLSYVVFSLTAREVDLASLISYLLLSGYW